MRQLLLIFLCPFFLKGKAQIDSLYVNRCQNISVFPNELYNESDSIYFYSIEESKWNKMDSNSTTYIFKDSLNFKLVSVIEIVDSLITYKYYYSNDSIYKISKCLMPDYIQLYTEDYYKNGQLISKGINTPDSLVKWTIYWENGNIKMTYSLKWGTFIGEYKEFHKNGKLKAKGNYPNEPFNNGKKVGKWYYYDEKGNILK